MGEVILFFTYRTSLIFRPVLQVDRDYTGNVRCFLIYFSTQLDKNCLRLANEFAPLATAPQLRQMRQAQLNGVLNGCAEMDAAERH